MAFTDRWEALSPRTRKAVEVVAAVEGLLKIAALIDLRRRGADGVHGSRKWWAVAIVLVNSAGIVPISYFVFGRRKSRAG